MSGKALKPLMLKNLLQFKIGNIEASWQLAQDASHELFFPKRDCVLIDRDGERKFNIHSITQTSKTELNFPFSLENCGCLNEKQYAFLWNMKSKRSYYIGSFNTICSEHENIFWRTKYSAQENSTQTVRQNVQKTQHIKFNPKNQHHIMYKSAKHEMLHRKMNLLLRFFFIRFTCEKLLSLPHSIIQFSTLHSLCSYLAIPIPPITIQSFQCISKNYYFVHF